METKIDLQTGDIVLVRANHFLARGIQIFMNIQRWFSFDFKPFYKKVSNHAAISISGNIIKEATKEGTVAKDVNEVYPMGCGRILKVYRYNFNQEQLVALKRTADFLDKKPYQTSNFLVYIIYILTFGLIWLGRRGVYSTAEEYCSEFVATCIYYSTVPYMTKDTIDLYTHQYFMKYWSTSPNKIEKWCETYCELVNVYER